MVEYKKYRYVADPNITQHGWLSIYSQDGDCLATQELWFEVDEYNLNRMETHECKPGQMIPQGDPRWYTHCQWCGQSIEGQSAAYYQGQWHVKGCYTHALEEMRRVYHD